MFLVFDTETTGLPKNYKAPLTDFDNWPRLVQLAWQCHDVTGKFLFAKNFVIKPVGFEIPEDASKIHFITTELANKIGVGLEEALAEFSKDVTDARLVIGHNVEFDINIVGCECLRAMLPNPLEKANTLCTKLATTGFCAIMQNGRPKWPTLTELHQKLFGTEFEEAHNAAGDVEATTRCFLELVRLNVLPLDKLKITQEEQDQFVKANPNPIEPAGVVFVSF